MNRTRILLSAIVILAGALALALLSGRQARAAHPAALGANDAPGQVLTTPTPPWTNTPLPSLTSTPPPCPAQFQDMPVGYPDADSVHCVVCQGIMSGFACGGPGEPCVPPNNWPYFRPEDPYPNARQDVTHIVSVGAGFNDPIPPSQQTYADIPPSYPYWIDIERMTMHGIIGGYPCGGPGEPCDPQQRPYFRPLLIVHRDQFSKILVNAVGWSLITPSTPSFTDVPTTSPFYTFVETQYAHGAMGGYPCGEPGEPCDPQQRPYFRPAINLNLVRHEMARVMARAFVPACPLSSPTPTATGTPLTNTPTRSPTPSVTPTTTITRTPTRTPGTPTPTPLPSCGGAWVPAIGAPDLPVVADFAPNDVWAAAGPQILHFDGANWNPIPTPPGTFVSGSSVEHDHTVSAVNTLGLVQWINGAWVQRAPLPTPYPGSGTYEFAGMGGWSYDNIWLYGHLNGGSFDDNGGVIFHWNGTQWIGPSAAAAKGSPASEVAPQGGGQIFGYITNLTVDAANSAWLVGYHYGDIITPGPDLIHRTSLAGPDAPQEPAGAPAGFLPTTFYTDVAVAGPSLVWVVGQDQGVAKTWQVNWPNLIDIPCPDIGPLVSVVAPAVDDAWATSSSGRIMHWDGTAWTEMPAPAPLYNLSASGSNDVWAVSIVSSTITLYHWPSWPTFSDVAYNNPFYTYVQALVCRGLISGYTCGGPGEPCDPGNRPYYRPGATVTRGQTAKIVSNAAGFADVIPTTQQTFADVPSTSPFWLWVERIAGRRIISGYTCGGPGEPCDPQHRPYFRPGNDVTRGQLAKIVSSAANFQDPVPTTQQTFADAPPSSPFWLWVERVAHRGIISGYACGGPGEPCDPQGRPYFRPNNTATRAQTAKIVTNVFFP